MQTNSSVGGEASLDNKEKPLKRILDEFGCKGRRLGVEYDAYAHVCDTSGMRDHRLNATGYSLGTTFAPSWMDWPMFYHANPVIAEENMVFFLHMILMDSDTHHAMCFGHTVVVTETGCEVLSRRSLDLIVK